MKWTVTGRYHKDLEAQIDHMLVIVDRRYGKKRKEKKRFTVTQDKTNKQWSAAIDIAVRKHGSDPAHFVVLQFLDVNNYVLFQTEAQLQDYK